jgi:hypothetical protein
MTNWIALLAFAVSATATPSAGQSQADIVNSGSTNTRGYVLHVTRSGSVLVDAQDGAGFHSASTSPDLAASLFEALAAAQPFSELPLGRCMKSASFGYSVRIRYDGASTPDLTCAIGPEEKTLASLVSEITRDAHLSDFTLRRRPIGPLRTPFPTPQPS